MRYSRSAFWLMLLLPAAIVLLSGFDRHSVKPGLKLAGVEYLGDLPTLLADKTGIFRRHGLEMAVSYGESGKDNLEKLKRGEVDYALMAATPFLVDKLLAQQQGEDSDTVVLANMLHATELNHIVTLKHSGIEQVNDLEGKTIGFPLGTNTEYLWWLYCQTNGIYCKSIEVVDIPPSMIGEALNNHRIDAAIIWQPWTARLGAEHGSALSLVPGKNLYAGKWLLVTTRQTLNQYPDITRDLLKAYSEAVNEVNQYPGKAVKIFADLHGHPYLLGQADELHTGLAEVSLDWGLVSEFNQIFQWYQHRRSQAVNEISPLSWISFAPINDVNPLALGIPMPEESSP